MAVEWAIIERDSDFNQSWPHVILKELGRKANWTKYHGFLMKTKLKPTDFWVGQSITALYIIDVDKLRHCSADWVAGWASGL